MGLPGGRPAFAPAGPRSGLGLGSGSGKGLGLGLANPNPNPNPNPSPNPNPKLLKERVDFTDKTLLRQLEEVTGGPDGPDRHEALLAAVEGKADKEVTELSPSLTLTLSLVRL